MSTEEISFDLKRDVVPQVLRADALMNHEKSKKEGEILLLFLPVDTLADKNTNKKTVALPLSFTPKQRVFVLFFVLFFYSRERESDTMIEIGVRDSSSFFLAEVQGGVWPSVRFYSQLASADEMHTLSNNQTNTSRRDETDLASCCESRCLYKQQAELKCDGPVLFSFLMRKPRSRERGLI